MDRIRIRGGRSLSGTIPISGAKNAALPLMATALLTDGPLTLTNAPDLADVVTMSGLLAQHGLTVNHDKTARTITLSGAANNLEAPYDLVRKMRASVLVLGPLVARFGRARVSLPGGCAIGTRPVDLHLQALEQMGAAIEITAGYIEATAPNGLKGARIIFPQVSVGATENILMAATLAQGTTEIVNAAREPEITDLAACLMRLGARIEGIGTDRLIVEGVTSLGPAVHPIIPDRIEAGTYACAAAITGGQVLLGGARLDHLGAVVRILRDAGGGCGGDRGRPQGLAAQRAARHGCHDRALPPALPPTCRPSSWP
jgi:UDP-N-acetylglucosamine 1-carboxyvinyltransferase